MNTAIGFRASGKSPGALAVRSPAAIQISWAFVMET